MTPVHPTSRQTDPPLSRASFAPTLDRQWARNLCSALFLLWEQSLLAIAVGQPAWMLDVPASSRASPLPHWIFSGQEICARHSSLCGSELARDSGGSVCLDVGCAGVIAGEPCSHTGSSVDKKLVFGTVSSVGAKLARDSGGSACLDVGYASLFASKPAPTLDRQWARNLCLAQFPLWERACSR